jgi:hypothetical protein
LLLLLLLLLLPPPLLQVNAPNIKDILPELFQENLMRGRGIFCQVGGGRAACTAAAAVDGNDGSVAVHDSCPVLVQLQHCQRVSLMCVYWVVRFACERKPRHSEIVTRGFSHHVEWFEQHSISTTPFAGLSSWVALGRGGTH